MKKTILAYVFLGSYLLIVFIATIFHGYNFTWYTNEKGEESILYMEFLFFTSIAFQLVMWWWLKEIKIAAAILSTLGNLFAAGLLTGLVMWGLGIDGVPRNLIFVYGTCYILIFSGIVAWQVKKVSRGSGYRSIPLS